MSDALLLFGEELQNLVDPQTPEDIVAVQRGLLLYRQNMAHQQKEGEDCITATVQDVVPCQVKLDLARPSNSDCSCKQSRFCRHQLAVFFTSYSGTASVSDWIQTWKNGKTSSPLRSNIVHLQKAKELFEEEKPVENTYESWKAYMEDTYLRQVEYALHQGTYTLSSKWDVYFQRVKAKMPLKAEWKLLYLFVGYFQTYLFLLRSLKQKDISPFARNFLEEEASELINNMFYTMEQLTRTTRPFAFDTFYKNIRDDLADLLEDQALPSASTDVYRAIWTQLLKEKTWRKAELEQLNGKIAASPAKSLLAASIHLSFLLEDEKAVTELLNRLDSKDYPLLTYWVRYFDEQKAAPFLRYAIEHISAYMNYAENHYQRKEMIQFLLPYVRKYCINNRKYDTFEKFCEMCLPYSFVYYSHYLLDSEKFRKWVELYIYNSVEIEYIAKDEIKLVQDHDPALLLPLYTSMVSEKIAAKNRQGYRVAVRYLKKIRTIYKKLKKQELWERYINQVQSANTRLRAFQEELKRGKLIDAE